MRNKLASSVWRVACAVLAVGVLSSVPPTHALAQTKPTALAVLEIPAPDPGPAIALRPVDAGALPEQWSQRGDTRSVRNVVNPTLTPVLPDPAKATGVAVIIAPGGAFRVLEMDGEGFMVAQWFAEHGIAAFVLKYRTVVMPRDRPGFDAAYRGFLSNPQNIKTVVEGTPEAIADAQAAVRLVRERASEWKLDPDKIGFVGFSAGAITALGVGLALQTDARPNFIAPLYPPMSARTVPADAPSMFVAIALDDPLFGKGATMGLIQSWSEAGRPLEVHLYEKGGHGFATGSKSAAAAMWKEEFLAWMKDRRILAK
jgi:acetyl esterase/lipase